MRLGKASSPVCPSLEHRYNVHRMTRLAFEPEGDWCVEILEESREHIAAQATFVLVNHERRGRT